MYSASSMFYLAKQTLAILYSASVHMFGFANGAKPLSLIGFSSISCWLSFSSISLAPHFMLRAASVAACTWQPIPATRIHLGPPTSLLLGELALSSSSSSSSSKSPLSPPSGAAPRPRATCVQLPGAKTPGEGDTRDTRRHKRAMSPHFFIGLSFSLQFCKDTKRDWEDTREKEANYVLTKTLRFLPTIRHVQAHFPTPVDN